MDIDITTRSEGIPDAAKDYARDKFGSAARIFDRIGSLHISLGHQKDGHHARCVAHLDSGAMLVAEATSEELRHAIEQGAEKLNAQVRKEKERLIDRHRRGDGGR